MWRGGSIPTAWAALTVLAITPGCGEELPTCTDAHKFGALLVPLDAVQFASPIGIMAPVGGSPLPKGHTGLMLSGPATVTAPGNLTITSLRETTYLISPTRQGYSDFSIEFAACREVQGNLGHLATLTNDLAAKVAGGDCSEYSTVDETVRSCVINVDLVVDQGAELGTAGVAPHSPALDVGLYDSRVSNFANPARYGNPRSAVCPWDFFTSPLRDSIYALLGDGLTPITEAPRCGAMAIDEPGTAKGRWTPQAAPANGDDATAGDFFVLAPNPYAGETQVVVSTRIAALDVAELAVFALQTGGQLNPDPASIQANGPIYCYDADVAVSTWSYLVRLDSADVLRVEKLTHAAGTSVCANPPATWAFSAAAVELIR